MRPRYPWLVAAATILAACAELPGGVGDVDAITLSPSATVLTLGDTARIDVTVLDADGRPLPPAQVHWSSNDRLIVHVDSGRVSAVGAGTTSITAESGGRSARTLVTVRMDLTAVTAGTVHTCGITGNRRLACWGSNSFGQIGNGTIFSSATPTLVLGAMDIVDVAAGGAHTCALTVAGDAYCWGSNRSGQLGLGKYDPERHDIPAPLAGSVSFASLTAGSRHTCGLTGDGLAYCWGGGFSGQQGTGTPDDFCATFDEPCNLLPTLVHGGLAFAQISAGQEHTCGLTLAGEAYCWGWNVVGQIGDSSLVDRNEPTPLKGGITFNDITAGTFHSCGIDTEGRAHCWGTNLRGELGVSDTLRESLVPIAVTGPHRFALLTGGEEHTCGISDNASAWCWGYNGRDQLGSNSVLRADEPVPAEAPPFATLTSGGAHVCGRALDGRVYCWGSNNAGQLGTGGFSRHTAAAVNGQ